MSKDIEIVTSVDAYGEIVGSHILNQNCFLVYGNGKDDYIVLGEIAGKLKRLRELVEASRWISVKERLPEEDKLVLVSNPKIFPVTYGWWCGDKWAINFNPNYDFRQINHVSCSFVTYWMPLPKEPVE